MDQRKREIFQFIITWIMRQVIKVMWIFPIRKNKIYCASAGGTKYCCNPKYIAQYLLKKYPNRFFVVYSMKNPKEKTVDGIHTVKFMSIKHFYHFCTSKIIIVNTGMPTYFPKRKGQKVINTWHAGGAYKNCSPLLQNQTKIRLVLDKYKSKCTDIALASCERYAQVALPDIVYKFKGEIMKCGLPRNDMFFDKDIDNVRKDVLKRLGIEDSFLTVLYAPTFRGNVGASFYVRNDDFKYDLDVERLCKSLQQRFDKEVKCIIRRHPAMKTVWNIKGVTDATDYPDMQELLCAADILITDYSSTIWDFSLLMRPCFLYVPDLENYIQKERGLYTAIEEWPGIIARNNEELQQDILHYDHDVFCKKVENHHKKMGSYEDGTACRQVANRIFQLCKI